MLRCSGSNPLAASKLAKEHLALPISANFQQAIQFPGGVQSLGFVVAANGLVIDKDLRHGSPAGQALHFGSAFWIIGDVDFFELNGL
jgi:hypothetical protein